MLGEKVRSIWADAKRMTDSGPTGTTDEDAPTGPNSSLFQCSECDEVYIALEKDRCSNCRTEVTEVSPTLSRA